MMLTSKIDRDSKEMLELFYFMFVLKRADQHGLYFEIVVKNGEKYLKKCNEDLKSSDSIDVEYLHLNDKGLKGN